jgi:hypothetical protein
MEIFRKSTRKSIKKIIFNEICEHRNYLYKNIGKKLDKLFNEFKENEQQILSIQEEENPSIQKFKDNILIPNERKNHIRKYTKRFSFNNKKIDEYLSPKILNKEGKKKELQIKKTNINEKIEEKKEETDDNNNILKISLLNGKRKRKRNKSNLNYKGITFDREKYTSRFEHKGRKYSGGRFFIAENAAKAYDSMVFTHLGFQKGKKKFNFIYNSPNDIPNINELREKDIRMNQLKVK